MQQQESGPYCTDADAVCWLAARAAPPFSSPACSLSRLCSVPPSSPPRPPPPAGHPDPAEGRGRDGAAGGPDRAVRVPLHQHRGQPAVLPHRADGAAAGAWVCVCGGGVWGGDATGELAGWLAALLPAHAFSYALEALGSACTTPGSPRASNVPFYSCPPKPHAVWLGGWVGVCRRCLSWGTSTTPTSCCWRPVR